MADFDAIESDAFEHLEPRSRSVRPGVRNDREPTGLTEHLHRIRKRQPLLRNVRRPPAADEPIERIAVILRPSVRDEHPRDVRSSDGPLPGLPPDRVELDRKA